MPTDPTNVGPTGVMNTLRLGPFYFDVPSNWFDYTDQVEVEDPPFTLAMVNGVGALQFSTARFVGGAPPEADLKVLEEFRDEFCELWLAGVDAVKESSESDTSRIASASGFSGEGFQKCWYLNCGQHFALITYTASPCSELPPVAQQELDESERIVRSAREAELDSSGLS